MQSVGCLLVLSSVKASRTTEQAKEEAMKLLKSGAISFDTGNERHVFKRKLKESDGGDSEDISGMWRASTFIQTYGRTGEG